MCGLGYNLNMIAKTLLLISCMGTILIADAASPNSPKPPPEIAPPPREVNPVLAPPPRAIKLANLLGVSTKEAPGRISYLLSSNLQRRVFAVKSNKQRADIQHAGRVIWQQGIMLQTHQDYAKLNEATRNVIESSNELGGALVNNKFTFIGEGVHRLVFTLSVLLKSVDNPKKLEGTYFMTLLAFASVLNDMLAVPVDAEERQVATDAKGANGKGAAPIKDKDQGTF